MMLKDWFSQQLAYFPAPPPPQAINSEGVQFRAVTETVTENVVDVDVDVDTDVSVVVI